MTAIATLSGDFIWKVTPVPIPNTAVKLPEPMIVPTSAKVGLAGFIIKTLCLKAEGFFMRDSSSRRQFTGVTQKVKPNFPTVRNCWITSGSEGSIRPFTSAVCLEARCLSPFNGLAACSCCSCRNSFWSLVLISLRSALSCS